MLTWFKRIVSPDRSHLWRNRFTAKYHDPAVLLRDLYAVGDVVTAEALRPLLDMRRLVDADGSGFAESQVERAYLDFLEWLEGKGVTARTSPTSAPSTDSPAT